MDGWMDGYDTRGSFERRGHGYGVSFTYIHLRIVSSWIDHELMNVHAHAAPGLLNNFLTRISAQIARS